MLCIYTPVDERNLKTLQSELHPVSHKWYSFGVQLQVPINTLKCIKAEISKMDQCLLKMLISWLKGTNPPPTWNILTEALESPPVGEERLAHKLRGKYCSRTEVGVTRCDPTQPPVLSDAISQGSSLKALCMPVSHTVCRLA